MPFHRSRFGALLGTVALLLALAPSALSGQEEPAQAGNGGLHVFFECHTGGCDFREFRTRIDWVSWVRDRQDAQVHVIVTSQRTGSGGRSYQLDFIGLEGLEGLDDELTYTSLGTDVRDETVQGLLRVLAVGLARYNVLAGGGAVLDVREAGAGQPDTDRLVSDQEVEDPWDFWVFEVGLSTKFSGESSRTNKRVSGSVEATRTT